MRWRENEEEKNSQDPMARPWKKKRSAVEVVVGGDDDNYGNDGNDDDDVDGDCAISRFHFQSLRSRRPERTDSEEASKKNSK